MTNIIEIQSEIKKELANKEVMNALVTTTFKGLDTRNIYLAVQEGMMRGFNFQDFLEKNIYAIPFKGGYSLVTSVDFARKQGMRSGVVGESEPIYEEKDGKLVACTITVKRKIDGYIGEYTAKVYFDEYTTGRNLWLSKPRTMLAKVAEMHALRKACPEEMAQLYTVDELGGEEKETTIQLDPITSEVREQVNNAKDMEELKAIYKENEGLGKEFARLVTAKKKELTDANVKA
jgi:hypothetical protein